MWKNGNKNVKIKAFSLIEIIVSLTIFSIVFTLVLGVSLTLVDAQKRIQQQMFLNQTAHSVVEDISRNLRFGYAYVGSQNVEEYDEDLALILSSTKIVYVENLENPVLDVNGVYVGDNISTTTDVLYVQDNDQETFSNSPYIIFENKDGDPRTYADQHAYCRGKRGDGTWTLYKIEDFGTSEFESGSYKRFCQEMDGFTVYDSLPSNIELEYLAFDIYTSDISNPKNPIVRIRLVLKDSEGREVFLQTAISQRLIQIL